MVMHERAPRANPSAALMLRWPAPARDRGATHWREAVEPTLSEIRETLLRPRAFVYEDTKLIRRLTVAMSVTTPTGISALIPEDTTDDYWSPAFWNSLADPADQLWVATWVGRAFALGTQTATSLDREPILAATMVDALVEQWTAQAWRGVEAPLWCSDFIWEIRRDIPGDSKRGYRSWTSMRADMEALLQAAHHGAPPSPVGGLKLSLGSQTQGAMPMGVLSGSVSAIDLASYCLALKILGFVRPRRMPSRALTAIATLEARLDYSGLSPSVRRRAQAEGDRLILERSTVRARKRKAEKERASGPRSGRTL